MGRDAHRLVATAAFLKQSRVIILRYVYWNCWPWHSVEQTWLSRFMQINQPIIFLNIDDRAQKATICVNIKQSQDQLWSSSRFRLRSLSLFPDLSMLMTFISQILSVGLWYMLFVDKKFKALEMVVNALYDWLTFNKLTFKVFFFPANF